MTDTTDHAFRGYTSPNYTPVPDVLFDEQLPELSGAELKVLLYVMRRTFGFKKNADDISLNQICSGITTREGAVLDRGTGLSKSTVQVAIKGLVERRIMVATKRVSVERGNEATTYELNVGDRPYAENRHRAMPKIDTGLYRKSAPQYTDVQKTADNTSINRNATAGVTIPGRTAPRPEADGASVPPPPLHTGATPNQNHSARDHGEPVAVGKTLERRLGRHPGTGEDREVIVAYLADFAREMNDQAPLRVSTSRALNLLTRSGMPRDVFLRKLYEARSLTKEHSASIQKTAIPNGSPFPVKAKMAYFFAVLEDLCGLKDDQAAVSSS